MSAESRRLIDFKGNIRTERKETEQPLDWRSKLASAMSADQCGSLLEVRV